MSSFDEAFRRKTEQEARHQSAEAQQLGIAENAARHVTQALRDFARALQGKVPPITLEYEYWDDPEKGGKRRPTGKIKSPAGYPPGGNQIVTPEGSLWEAQSSTVSFKFRSGILREPSWSERTTWRGGYVEITADALIHGRIRLGNQTIILNWHFGGRPEVDSRRTPVDVTLEPVEDVLAQLAHELIRRQSSGY